MNNFRDEFDLEMALKVVQNEAVDSQTWGDAVKWLLLYGPPEIKEVLEQASAFSVNECFPGLKPTGMTPEGQACYSISDLAESLGVSEKEAYVKLSEMEEKYGMQHIFVEGKDGAKVQ